MSGLGQDRPQIGHTIFSPNCGITSGSRGVDIADTLRSSDACLCWRRCKFLVREEKTGHSVT